MTERPILFSGPMVRALLDDRKTQTRRIVKPQPPPLCIYAMNGNGDKALCMQEGGPIKPWFVPPRSTSADTFVRCPYGVPGDRLWVRETWAAEFNWPEEHGNTIKWFHEMPAAFRGLSSLDRVYYAADRDAYATTADCTALVYAGPMDGDTKREVRWKPSIHMPRWASRLTLEVTGVRVERVQDISGADAIAEGFGGQVDAHEPCARDKFLSTFYDLNERAPRTENSWVWVIEFRRVA